MAPLVCAQSVRYSGSFGGKFAVVYSAVSKQYLQSLNRSLFSLNKFVPLQDLVHIFPINQLDGWLKVLPLQLTVTDMAYKHAVCALNFAPEHLHSCPESSSTILSLPGQRGTDLPLAPISSQLCSHGGLHLHLHPSQVGAFPLPRQTRRSIPCLPPFRPGAAHGVRPPISSVPRQHHEAHDLPLPGGVVRSSRSPCPRT
ncbi:hypothetical protein PVAP13_1KG469015 [Panicum virgatum]|uniref:Uncharacterized protein n=1 Tax=Panicum virgatum TaxID=38727 RepID=A0A8T0XHK6_PANVG|nr:hypothetical protein PVAP13_1KG469015 [Panicum virgatum]